MSTDILTTALALHDAGYAVLPIRADGSKAPAVPEWRSYMTEPQTRDQVTAWFTDTPHGLAVIQGAISGRAELTELEGRAVDRLPELRDLAAASGLADLWTRVTTGWMESSPSGGIHLHYRIDGDVPGNTKLARRPGADGGVEVLAETRGEGGYVVVAPTPGTHHPTGRPWTRLLGGPDTAPVLTLDERTALHTILRTLDAMPARDVTTPARPASPRDPADGVTPGDDYEARTDWADILGPHDWTLLFTRGRTRYWRRPGKTAGISATTGHADDRDRLYVFSSSTEFEQETPYTKLGALAVLEHGGDHSAAARALAAAGYGQRATRLRPADADDLAGLIAPTKETTCNATTSPTAPTTLAPATDAASAPATSPVAPATSTGAPTPMSARTGGTDGSSALAPDPTPRPRLTIAPDPAPDVPRITRNAEPNQDNTALLLVDEHHDAVRYCAGRGDWLTWNGHRWATDDRETVREHARAIARRLPDGEGWARYRNSALSANGIGGIVRLAQSDPRVAVLAQQLDAHPEHLCTPGGIVNLRTGTLSHPDPAALHTRATTVTPDPTCPTPRWTQFLNQTFAGRPDLIAFVQRLAGYSSLGTVTRHVLPFLLGPGGNGKSVFLDVLRALLGDYAATTPAKFLMAGVNQHETEIARLSGLRLVISSEVNEEDRFDEAKVKLLTGGDALTARFMHQNHFTFTPTHTLWLMGNHQPRVSAGGDSFWRRLRLVPFEHTVPDDQRIDGLDKLLVADEGPGILSWIIDGARLALTDGLAEPDVVMAATRVYASEEDHLARFVEDRIHLSTSATARENTAAVRRAYDTWCRDQGERPMSPQAFGRELRTRYGIDQKRSHGARFYTGLTLLADDTDADAPDEWWQS